MIPKNPPKFKVGDHVIPRVPVYRDSYPEGYIIGLIALSIYEESKDWVYWGMHEERHVRGWILTPGFAEPHIELYEETDHVG